MNYITIVLLIIGVIIVGIGNVMLFAKVTMQDKEILFWIKNQSRTLELVDVNMKGINSMQKIILYQQSLLNQLISCNVEGGLVIFDDKLNELQESALKDMEVHNKALVNFADKYDDNKETKEDILAQEQLQEQLYDILNVSPNKGALG